MIAEGSSKLASVPSGGSGGGAAAPSGGAGAAAPEEKAEEKKEEGMHYPGSAITAVANLLYREGRVRRRHGLRSFRLRYQSTWPWKRCSGLLVYRQGFWKGLCGLKLFLHAMGVKGRFLRSSREGIHPWTLDSQYRQYRRASSRIVLISWCKLENQCRRPGQYYRRTTTVLAIL